MKCGAKFTKSSTLLMHIIKLCEVNDLDKSSEGKASGGDNVFIANDSNDSSSEDEEHQGKSGTCSDYTRVCSICFDAFETDLELSEHTAFHREVEMDTFEYSNSLHSDSIIVPPNNSSANPEESTTEIKKKKPSTNKTDFTLTPQNVESEYGSVRNQSSVLCLYCKEEFPFAVITEHMITCHSDIDSPKFGCSQCGSGFKNCKTLKMHIQIYHVGKYYCFTCRKSFETKWEEMSHDKTHYVTKRQVPENTYAETNVDNCNNNEKLLPLRTTILAQQRRVDSPKVKCRICNLEYSQHTLESHMRFMHENVTSVCSGASKNIEKNSSKTADFNSHQQNLGTLNDNEMESHEDASPDDLAALCLYCNEVFQVDTATMHMRKHHPDIKPIYGCLYCHRMFKICDNLRRHVKLDHSGKYCCRRCSKSFKTNKARAAHYRAHCVYNCNVCKKSFTVRKAFLNHRIKVHSSRVSVRSACNLCGLSFVNLKNHMKRHAENRKMFSCTRCKKQYISERLANRCLSRHENLKQFECKECGKEFFYYESLKVHMIIHT